MRTCVCIHVVRALVFVVRARCEDHVYVYACMSVPAAEATPKGVLWQEEMAEGGFGGGGPPVRVYIGGGFGQAQAGGGFGFGQAPAGGGFGGGFGGGLPQDYGAQVLHQQPDQPPPNPFGQPPPQLVSMQPIRTCLAA